MTSRDEHHESVGFAGNFLEDEMIPLLAATREKAEEAVGIVHNAVGSNPSSEAGQNALGRVSFIGSTLEELIAVAHDAIAELNRYGGGF